MKIKMFVFLFGLLFLFSSTMSMGQVQQQTTQQQITHKPRLTLIPLPDLQVNFSCPSTIVVGADIVSQVTLKVWNSGNAPAIGLTTASKNGYMVDLMLSTDTNTPVRWAVYSPNFSEDVLLRGGRISNTETLKPGQSKVYQVGARIPADTPTGVYYICAKVDAGNKITEVNEANNSFCKRVYIKNKNLKLPNFKIITDNSILLVGKSTEISLQIMGPPSGRDLVFNVSITDSFGKPAMAFGNQNFTLHMRRGTTSVKFRVLPSKPYPAGVIITVRLQNKKISRRMGVIYAAEIADLLMENKGEADSVTIDAGLSRKCTVYLDKPSLSGGTEISLLKEGPDAEHISFHPKVVIIPRGRKTGSFIIKTNQSAKSYCVIKGKTIFKTSVLTVNFNPWIRLADFKIIPFHFHRGQNLEGFVTITNQAPAGGQLINLQLSDFGAQFVQMPETITIPQGKTEGRFNIKISDEAKKKAKITFWVSIPPRDRIKRQYTISPYRLLNMIVDPPLMEKRESKLFLQLDGPTPTGGLPCVIDIRTPQPENKKAYGFRKRPYHIVIPSNQDSITIPITSKYYYPKGVDIIFICQLEEIRTRSHFDMISKQKIESFTITPQPIIPGRTGLAIITLNRPALQGKTTQVIITLHSETARDFVGFRKEVVVPINQVQGMFSLEIRKGIKDKRIWLWASLPSGERKSLEVNIKH
jgi:hypothetical protein